MVYSMLCIFLPWKVVGKAKYAYLYAEYHHWIVGRKKFLKRFKMFCLWVHILCNLMDIAILPELELFWQFYFVFQQASSMDSESSQAKQDVDLSDTPTDTWEQRKAFTQYEPRSASQLGPWSVTATSYHYHPSMVVAIATLPESCIMQISVPAYPR